MEKIIELINFLQYIAAVVAILTVLPCVIGLMEKDFPIKPKHVIICLASIIILQIVKIIIQ